MEKSGAEDSANLNIMQTSFATKIDGVLDAIRDVKKDIRDFSGRMDEAGVRIIRSEFRERHDLIKKVAALTNKLLKNGFLKFLVRKYFPHRLSLRERTVQPSPTKLRRGRWSCTGHEAVSISRRSREVRPRTKRSRMAD